MRDPGDEHVDAPVVVAPIDPIGALLAEDDSVQIVAYETMRFIMLAEAYRYCCRACALEVDGEDGS